MNSALLLVLFALGGIAAGWLFFGALRWMSQQLVAPGPVAWGRLALVHALRFGALLLLLVACAHQGAGPLLAFGLGLLVARVGVVARARAAKERTS